MNNLHNDACIGAYSRAHRANNSYASNRAEELHSRTMRVRLRKRACLRGWLRRPYARGIACG